MALSQEQAQALDALSPPESLDRIIRFLSDLGAQGNTPLGESGRSAQAFAASVAGGAHSFSARQTSGWVAILMDRYQIKLGEIQEFALWFVQRQDILAETNDTGTSDLAERAPAQILARPAPPAVSVMAANAAPAMSGLLAAAPSPFPAVAADSRAADRAANVPARPAPRAASRRLPVAPPLPAVAPPLAEPLATELAPAERPASVPDDRPSRRQAGRGVRTDGSAPRGRRIERGSPRPGPDTGDAPEPETMPEEAAAEPKRFRLKPSMITRPAFVANVGLGGMLAGISLAQAQAGAGMTSLAAPTAMLPASAPWLNLGPTLGQPPGGPMGLAMPTAAPALLPIVQPMVSPAIAPAFTPTVAPMTTVAPAAPPSGVWLGMPPAPPSPAPPSLSPDGLHNASGWPDQPIGVLPLSVPGPLPPVIPASVLVPGMSPEVFAMPPANSPAPAAAPTGLPDGAAPPSPNKPPPLAATPPAQSLLPPMAALMSVGAPALANPALTSPPLAGMAAGSAAVTIANRLLAPQTGTNAGSALPLPLAPGAFKFAGTGGTASSAVGAAPGQETAVQETVPPARLPTVTAEMGQITLMAPPLQVASAQAERGGVAASLDWQTLADGAHPLDAGSLARLTQSLPDQAGVLYPALPPGSLGKGAVNLPLSMPLVQSLLQKGYGNVGEGMAAQAADMAASAGGGKPPAAPLAAQLVPTGRPAGASAGLLGHPDETAGGGADAPGGAGALTEAGQGQATRGGVMDFLGMPIRLAPSLGGRSDLARETAVRNSGQGPVKSQQTLRPEQFTPLRNRLFPAFHSMTVEPDTAAWRKAAPAFGLRDSKLTTLLAPDARVPVQTPTAPQPPSAALPPAAAGSDQLPGRPFSPSLLASGRGPLPPQGHRAAFGSQPGAGPFSLGAPPMLGAHPASPALPGLSHHKFGPGALGSGVASFLSRLPHVQSHLGGLPTPGLPGHTLPGLGAQGAGMSRPAFPLSFPNLLGGPAHPVAALPNASSPGLGASVHGHSGAAAGANTASFTPSAGSRNGFPGGAGSSAMPRSLPGPAFSGSGGSGSASSLPGFTPARPGGASFHRPEAGRLAPGPGQAGTNFPPLSIAPPNIPLPGGHGGAGSAHKQVHLPAPALAVPSHGISPLFLPASQLVPSVGTGPSRAGVGAALNSRLASLRPAGARVTGPGMSGGLAGAVPAMRFATPQRSGRRPAGETARPMTIQRAETTTTATPARNDGSRPAASAKTTPENGAAGSEINALAGEVWSLLKRRLANEAERRGRW